MSIQHATVLAAVLALAACGGGGGGDASGSAANVSQGSVAAPPPNARTPNQSDPPPPKPPLTKESLVGTWTGRISPPLPGTAGEGAACLMSPVERTDEDVAWSRPVVLGRLQCIITAEDGIAASLEIGNVTDSASHESGIRGNNGSIIHVFTTPDVHLQQEYRFASVNFDRPLNDSWSLILSVQHGEWEDDTHHALDLTKVSGGTGSPEGSYAIAHFHGRPAAVSVNDGELLAQTVGCSLYARVHGLGHPGYEPRNTISGCLVRGDSVNSCRAYTGAFEGNYSGFYIALNDGNHTELLFSLRRTTRPLDFCPVNDLPGSDLHTIVGRATL